MENKTNIAELLKDSPKGMELDCNIYDNCTLEIVFEGCLYPIQIRTPEGLMNLTKYGSMSESTLSKCVIFPKGKTTWEGFVPPYQFKDGDILTSELGSIFILKEPDINKVYYSCYIALDFASAIIKNCKQFCSRINCRFATEEEKQKLFDTIKVNGYKWNPETKTLEKLPRFKVGDRIRHKNNSDIYCTLEEYSEGISAYRTNIGLSLTYKDLEQWELAPNKFDITSLVPFESRVLVRDDTCYEWEADIFGRYSDGYITLGGGKWKQCIPYEGNEHLLGKTDDCDDFYKTWKE